ncbi:nuclear transport factor 2 family protein [uncultured Croceitalea sp.]|uniref:nuclear transport factor 2 family protein n=1 Tax=uncultured Croceitalea sp. TaxID=1798908 RepID=UPI00330577A0
MKLNFIFLGLFLFSGLSYAQPNTEVYVFDLNIENSKVVLSNPKNISNNDGYDNQPSFLNNTAVLFASTRSDQTDIKLFDIEAGSISSWITDTPTGSEYSPLKIPNKKAVSAIRLDLDGLQRLYQYDISNGNSKLILEDLKVGYHVWHNDHILVSTVLVENRMDLVVSNLKDKTNYTFQKNVGRNLLKIPNTDLISFISKEGKSWQIKSLNPITGATKNVVNTFKNSEDICWLKDGSILTGDGKSILRINPKSDIKWEVIHYFKQEEINNITRIAVSENSKRLAFVAEESPAKIVQKQLDAYNARDIDAFMSTYTNDITLVNFPDKVVLKGQEKMRESYATYFDATPDLNCEIKNRIIIGNKVIDEEFITANGQNFSAVAIYEVENGKISKVTFIQ